tara:strand:- start:1379 stop:2524 length:1146 start_codon:yes stop_codon:yes gene_type:complete
MNNIALIVYGRFPTEKAYGSHIIDVANGFLKNGLKVDVIYSKTFNSKTIYQDPVNYYKNSDINFHEFDNFDFTSLKFYKILPKILQKLIWNLGAIYWGKKLNKIISNYDAVWSTNPNVLFGLKFSNCHKIYEKHGAARYFQKLIIKKISKFEKYVFVGTTKTSFNELKKLNKNNTIYLTNGVDINTYTSETKESNLNIGYIGMLETYGKDKGVRKAFKILKELSQDYEFEITLIGGPNEKIDEIKNDFKNYTGEINFQYRIPKDEVPYQMSKLDIGLVPYPNDFHMSNYASPMKIFEYASAQVVVLASDIKSHLELDDFQLGIHFFKESNDKSLKKELIRLITDKNLRENLISKSNKNIKNFTWEIRNKKLIDFCVRSSIG